ncbi:unnamed protein product [Microthlaspi erraticum]|uniref:Plant thionin family protein n=1 Tax=Microthlaspi erraticum TaxID=1685480 RepID=A0A6D2HDM2_9BRAS|nr:unnamed protein product [Microthlaspi erraticum]
MAKWSAIVVIMMMVVIAATVTVQVEAKQSWIQCFRECSKPCADHDGDCFERCKVQCGGPNPPHGPTPPPHGPTPPPRRISRGMASMEVRGRRE